MNITSYVSEASAQFSNVPPSAYPALLLSYYVEYLWNYKSDSWVGRVAYSCRLLAIFFSLPVIILALVDISSYVIARTLGVVDDVKASTSDKPTQAQTPAICVAGGGSGSGSSTILVAGSGDSLGEVWAPQHPKEFFATEKNLKLSGVGILSPAATRPPSPVLMRSKNGTNDVDVDLRQRQQQAVGKD